MLPFTSAKDAQYYQNGRGLARYNGQQPLASEPPPGTPVYWTNEGVKDVWAGVPSRTGTETQYYGEGGALLPPRFGPEVQPQQAPPPNQPPVVIRPGIPRPAGGGGVYVPPPGGVFFRTFELYGSMYGRPVPLSQVLRFRYRTYSVARGGRVLVGDTPADGFGYAGVPGRWNELFPGTSPSAYGQDADKGIVGFDGRTAWPIPAKTLNQIFGYNWRLIVYPVAPPAPPVDLSAPLGTQANPIQRSRTGIL